MDLVSLLTIAGAFFVAAASPGPATIAVATVSMSAGRRSGLLFGMGLAVGLAFWGVVAAGGLGAILLASAQALSILKLLGGAYLIWLAIGNVRSAMSHETSIAVQSEQARSFAKGLLLNLSNPKAVFAWMAVLALGFEDASGVAHLVLSTGTCMCIGFLIYAGYALGFSTPGAMRVYSKLRRWIDSVAAGLFAIAGAELIRSAFSRQ